MKILLFEFGYDGRSFTTKFKITLDNDTSTGKLELFKIVNEKLQLLGIKQILDMNLINDLYQMQDDNYYMLENLSNNHCRVYCVDLDKTPKLSQLCSRPKPGFDHSNSYSRYA